MATTNNEAGAFAAGVAQIRSEVREAIDVARDLVARLTPQERLGLLDGDQDFWAGILDMGRNG